MRRAGKYLLVGGGVICLQTLLMFAIANAASEELEVIDTTPYLVWSAAGALALILGAVFFAAGEVVRVLGPPDSPPPGKTTESRSHFE